MSRTYHHGKYQKKEKAELERYRKLGLAILGLTEAQLEKEARVKRSKVHKRNKQPKDGSR